PPRRYVGIRRAYSMAAMGGIPQQWDVFRPYLEAVDQSRIEAAYGIVRNALGEEVEYITAVPSGSGLQPDGELVEIDLPQMQVAQFAHRGHISAIQATFDAIFSEALPAAGLRPEGSVDLIERYGPDFDPRSGFG